MLPTLNLDRKDIPHLLDKCFLPWDTKTASSCKSDLTSLSKLPSSASYWKSVTSGIAKAKSTGGARLARCLRKSGNRITINAGDNLRYSGLLCQSLISGESSAETNYWSLYKPSVFFAVSLAMSTTISRNAPTTPPPSFARRRLTHVAETAAGGPPIPLYPVLERDSCGG